MGPTDNNVNVNLSLTGSQAVVEGILEYVRSMSAAGDVTMATSASADKFSKSMTILGKEIGAVAKAVADVAKALGSFGAEANKTATANERVSKSASVATEKLAAEGAAIKKLIDESLGASSGLNKLAASEEKTATATKISTTAIENQTRQLLLQRDALVASMGKQQKMVDNLAANAPRLNRTAMYIAAGTAGILYEGIKQYMNFNAKMTQVYTEAGVAANKQAQLTKNMGSIAKETGRGFNDLADALYRVGSATAGMHGGKGATTKELTGLVKETAKLAVIGNLAPGAQSDQAARVIGAVRNSGIAGTNPKKIAAQVNAIVGAGDIRMSEFITALGRGVLTSGKSVGLSLKDIGAYVDLLTSRGTTGASAGTYVAHAFQLLAGSTAQAAHWQAAIGLQGGEMTNVMKNQGLNASVKLMWQKMQKLDATPENIKMMQKAGLSDEQIAAWTNGLVNNSDMQRSVMQRAMTAMFGGGRQAMPLMALLQSAGIDISKISKGFKGAEMGQGPTLSDIRNNIDTHSTIGHYDAVSKAALNTPKAREQQTLRKLQWDLIEFGRVATPVWLGFLSGANKVMDFFMKFKGYLVEIGVVLAGILGLALVKQGARLAVGVRNAIGAASFYGQTKLKGVKQVAEGSWADKYASGKGLKGSTAYANQEAQLVTANAQLDELGLILAELQSIRTIEGMQLGENKGLSNASWNAQRSINEANGLGGGGGYGGYGGGGRSGIAGEAARLERQGLSQVKILSSSNLKSIEQQAAQMAEQSFMVRGPGGRFGKSKATLAREFEHQLISQAAPLDKRTLVQMRAHAAQSRLASTYNDPAFFGKSEGQRLAILKKQAIDEYLTTGKLKGVAGFENLGARTVASEAGRVAETGVARAAGSGALGVAEKVGTAGVEMLARGGAASIAGGAARMAGMGLLGMAGGPVGIGLMLATTLGPIVAPSLIKGARSLFGDIGHWMNPNPVPAAPVNPPDSPHTDPLLHQGGDGKLKPTTISKTFDYVNKKNKEAQKALARGDSAGYQRAHQDALGNFYHGITMQEAGKVFGPAGVKAEEDKWNKQLKEQNVKDIKNAIKQLKPTVGGGTNFGKDKYGNAITSKTIDGVKYNSDDLGKVVYNPLTRKYKIVATGKGAKDLNTLDRSLHPEKYGKPTADELSELVGSLSKDGRTFKRAPGAHGGLLKGRWIGENRDRRFVTASSLTHNQGINKNDQSWYGKDFVGSGMQVRVKGNIGWGDNAVMKALPSLTATKGQSQDTKMQNLRTMLVQSALDAKNSIKEQKAAAAETAKGHLAAAAKHQMAANALKADSAALGDSAKKLKEHMTLSKETIADFTEGVGAAMKAQGLSGAALAGALTIAAKRIGTGG